MAQREFSAYVVLVHPDSKQATTFAPGDVVPEWATVGDHATSQGVTRSAQTNDEAPASDVTPVADEAATETVTPEYETEDLPPYEEWSKTDLRAEVDGRELEVPKRATVDELVEALKADDAAVAEEE